MAASNIVILRTISGFHAGFAIVKLGTDKQTGEEWAIKIMALPEENSKPTDNENTRYAFSHAIIVCMTPHYAHLTQVYPVSATLPCTPASLLPGTRAAF